VAAIFAEIAAATKTFAAWWSIGLSGFVERVLGARRIRAADAQLLSAHASLLQITEDLFRHAFWQIYKAVIFANVDSADELAFKARFIGNRANNVAGFDAVQVANFNAIGFALDAIAFFATLWAAAFFLMAFLMTL
jgi:hypothetical protein